LRHLLNVGQKIRIQHLCKIQAADGGREKQWPTCGVPSLYHEGRDEPMEQRVIVCLTGRQRQEVFTRFGRLHGERIRPSATMVWRPHRLIYFNGPDRASVGFYWQERGCSEYLFAVEFQLQVSQAGVEGHCLHLTTNLRHSIFGALFSPSTLRCWRWRDIRSLPFSLITTCA